MTGCELKNEKSRENVIKNMRQNEKMIEMVAFMQKGVMCVGFPDLEA